MVQWLREGVRIDVESVPSPASSKNISSRIQDELDRLVNNGSLEVTDEKELLHAAPVFSIDRADGRIRLIHDLRRLNEVTKERRTFRLYGIKQAVRSLTNKTWMTKADLVSGYNQVGVHPDSKRLLGIITDKQAYKWNVLGFGWTASPWVFQTIMLQAGRIIMKRHGVLLIIYLDDILFMSEDRDKLEREMPRIRKTMQRLGLIVNPKKCELIPRQQIGFLGVNLDAAKQEMSLTREKADAYGRKVTEALAAGRIPSGDGWLSLLGKLSFFAGTTTGGFLRLRALQQVVRGGGPITLSAEDKKELVDWERLLKEPPPRSFADLRALWGINPAIDLHVTSDAAEKGWGATAYYDGKLSSSQGHLPRLDNIMERELYGAWKALELLDGVRGREVTLFTDNSAVVSWVNKQGSVRASKSTMKMLQAIQKWKETNFVALRAVHIAGHLNVGADRLSRFQKLEWRTPRGVLEAIQTKWGPLQIDATAGPDKKLTLPGFVDMHWSRSENGLGRDWRGLRVFLAPPWALLNQVAQKLQTIRDDDSTAAPRHMKSCAVVVFPDIMSPAARALKAMTRFKMYFGVPKEQFEGKELHRLADKRGNVRLIAMLIQTSTRRCSPTPTSSTSRSKRGGQQPAMSPDSSPTGGGTSTRRSSSSSTSGARASTSGRRR